MNAAECLMQTAQDAGVEVCFANPGTTEMPLVAAMDRFRGMRAVLGLFEGVCTGAADGYGRMLDRPAMTLLHLGPGFANGIANLHNARRAHSPIVNLIGDQTTSHLAYDAPLTSDIESLARPVSGWVRSNTDPGSLAADFADAVGAATGPPAQVATLIVPADCQWGPAARPATVPQTAPSRCDNTRVDAAAALLREARNPALLVGGRALREKSLRAAARVAQATGARLLSETFPARLARGRGIPTTTRLPYFPEQAHELLREHDALVLVGARDPVAFFGYPDTPSRLRPDDVPCAELCGEGEDSGEALARLVDALSAGPHADDTSVLLPAPPDGPIDPVSMGAILARKQPEGAVVVDEAATSGLAYSLAAEAALPHTALALTGGAIGQGLPVAVGAAIACPDRKVIALQADGSGLYTLQALWTQARESLDITTVVCANRRYRILQVELARAGVAEPGPKALGLTELTNPSIDWVALGSGLGVPSVSVSTNEAFARELSRGLAEAGPHLIEVLL